MIRINLLPVREARRKAGVRQQAILMAASVIGALLVAWTLHFFVSRDIDQAKVRIAQLQQQLKQFEPRKAELAEYKQKKAEIEQKLAAIAKLERSRTGMVRVMDELASRTPERVWLTKLAVQGDQIELEGMSLDPELVASLLTGLERSPYFDGVELDSTELKQVQELKLNTFRIRARLVLPDEGGPVADAGAPAGAEGRG